MAESLLSFGVEKLWDLLVRESERFQGVGEQINELKSDLNMLRCFLEDADAKKHTSAMVRNTVKDIKEIVYDAEDIIETFLRKEELRRTSGIKKRIRQLACVLAHRRKIAFDMEVLHKRIAKVIRDMQSLGVQQVIVNDGSMQSLQERQRQMRQTFSDNNEIVLVGLEEDVKKLVGHLVEVDRSQVVSITGMGGIGKTTLARQVFNHETVKSHFAGHAWVYVSQQFTRKDVWQTILRKVGPEYIKSETMTEDELQKNLFRVLETRMALIVLDDIWREEDWDFIKPIFPPGKEIILYRLESITSRNEGVALRADPNCFNFKPDCLTLEESWTIFRKIVFSKENTTEYKFDEEMAELGKKMIKHCGGLPLAVKLLGGLLAAQHTLREWKRISENIKSHVVGGTSFNDRNISSVYHILYLSFKELPIYLKHCFLYSAHFREDDQINLGNDMCYYWAAEGIPRPRYYDGATIQEVGDGYIDELVKRNMVISKRDVRTSRFKTCHLHDMMREVCLRKAEEENFVHIVDIANSQSPCNSRRIAVHELDETYHLKWQMQNPKLRSILFIKDYSRKEWMESGLCFTRLQLMRILDLSYVKFKGRKLPSDIGKLIHLRYLSLRGVDVTHLPSSMRNLKQLFYLKLNVYGKSPIYMPNFLKEMRELTYLSLPEEMQDKTKLELGNLVNLQTLKNFLTEHSRVKDIERMKKLRSLSIYIKGNECNVETLSSSLSELKHLEVLDIYAPTNDETRFVLKCIYLKKLKLRIYMPKLPDQQHFPSNLTTIKLSGCRLEEDPMPILEKLLQLREVRLLYNSFSGRRMVCSGGGYPQLHTLELYRLDEWEEWIVEEGSMPILSNLTIWDCRKLKEVPDGLRFIYSLKDLIIQDCPNLKEAPDGQRFPSNLITISLRVCGLEKDPMPLLENLLHLKEVRLWPQSISGRRMVCSGGGFPQLQELSIWGLNEWEEWIIEEGSMPLLHTLTIRGCKKLKELPDGLRFIYSLKNLSMDKEWKERLSEGGEDFYKVQHIPSVEFLGE